MKFIVFLRHTVILLALGGLLDACAATSRHESTGAFIDDAAITTKVKATLFDDLVLKGFQIHVRTAHEVVQLTGTVDSEQNKARAAQVAGGVEGVRSVQNDLVTR